MSNTVRIKRRSSSGAAGSPTTLENAELAYNEADDILYYGKGTSGPNSATIEAIGGFGAFTTLGTVQTLTGNKTFSGVVIVPTPTANTHAATKLYVDSVADALATSFTVAGDSGSNQTITSGSDTLTISGGTGLTSVAGSTDIITLNLDNTAVTAGSYGGAGTVGTFTVDAQGRLTAAGNTSISITSATITDFTEAAQDAVESALTAGTGVSKTYDDVANTITLSIGQAVGTSSNVTFGTVTAALTGNVTGTVSSLSNQTTANLTELTNLYYTDARVRANRLDQLAAPAADVSLNSYKITGLADPTSAQDAATKAYVDAARQGLDVKASVRAIATANITLSGTQTIDGVAVIAGERVLVIAQTSAPTNGIYVVAAGGWSRADDTDSSAKVTTGMFTFVSEGTDNADSGWVLTTNDAITLGTTALVFTQNSGAGQVTAGAGLTKTGSTLDAVGTADRITVAADAIDIASTYVGQATITTLGTITTGTWSGTTIALNKGGTGATTDSGARTALGLVIGTDVQAYDGELAALAGLTSAADSLPYFTGSGTASLATLTSFGRSLIDDADATAARVTLALGTMAIQNASSITVTGGTLSAVTISNSIIDGGTF